MRPDDTLRTEAHAILSELRELWNEWDPIGVASDALQDEYDSYLAPTLRLMNAGASEDELTKYLTLLVREKFGLDDDGVTHLNPRAFAQDLLAWVVSPRRRREP